MRMNKLKYILMTGLAALLTTTLTTSCMDDDDDWIVTGMTAEEAGIGNSSLTETNVVTIAELKNQYKSYIETSYTYKQIETATQIKGVVTGNDIEGNLYNELAIDDGTGAIIVAISKGGLFGTFPVGTEVLIELNGLYVGNYGKTATIGTPYTNSSGNTYVSRMSSILWEQHYKLTGNTSEVTPVEFDPSTSVSTYGTELCAKLITLKGVKLQGADGTATYANPSAGSGSKSVYFTGLSSSVFLYNSNYADFAANVMPTGTVNVTGILKRYNNNWEIILRSIDDVEEVDE